MSSPPFTDFSKPLRDTLQEDYIADVAHWLLRSDFPLLAQASNSDWETALSLLYLHRCHDLYSKLGLKQDLREETEEVTTPVCRWLAERTQSTESGNVCWDFGIWDTAVCIRSIVHSLSHFPSNFSSSDTEKLYRTLLTEKRI